jgi:coenzyme F420-reducing hydrogenase delta subunit
MTYEDIKRANEALKTIDVKGKNYVQVNERVKALRMICPGASIVTDIVSLEGGVVTMRATVSDENGNVLGTGFAQEKETSSYINKTSYIENCETSAVGRALGFAGIGIDGSMASAEEVANAMLNQGNKEVISAKEVKILKNLLEKKGIEAKSYRGVMIEALTGEQYAKALDELKKMDAKNGQTDRKTE